MANWQVLTQVPIGGRLQSVVDSISDILEALATALKLLTTALEIIKSFAFLSLNLIKEIVEAVVALIEELLHDLLEYNVAMALHVNMNWNPFWVLNKGKERDPRTGKIDGRLVDYANDGLFPWAGTGLTGWLVDLLASTNDPTNPFRPVTDENTSVYGVMIIKGVANPGDVESILRLDDWYRLFSAWDVSSLDFGRVTSSMDFESLQKLGTTALMNTLGSLYQMGPKDRQILPVQAFVDANSSLASFFPTPGAYPKWVSTPMAALVPPLQGAIEDLRMILGLLRFSDDLGDSLGRLIDAISAKVDLLMEALAQVQDAIEFILEIAAFLTDAYIIVHNVPAGGMAQFISDVILAGDAPNFGLAGIVVGVTLVATQPDSQASIDKFLEILGIKTSAFVEDTTALNTALDETFEELLP